MIRPLVPCLLAFLSAAALASAQEVGGYMNSDGTQRTLYIGETGRSAGLLTFGCFGGDLTIAGAKVVRAVIPGTLGMQWDTTATPILGGPQSGKIATIEIFTKTIRITTFAGGLNAGDVFTIGGMRYANVTTASSDALFFDKDGDLVFTSHAFGVDDRDPVTNTVTIANDPANFSIAGAANQTFRTGDADVVCPQISITEAASFPGIKVGSNIRIQIPAGLDMSFNPGVTTVTVTGSASAKVDRFGVTYPGGSNKIADIPVTTPFATGDTLTIDGLTFTGFGSASGPFGLDLVLNGGSYAVLSSSKTFTVGGLPSISMAAPGFQTFGRNDPDTTNLQITVSDVSVGVPIITAASNIDIRIPNAFQAEWNTSDTSGSLVVNGAGTGAVGAVSFPSNKIMRIDVTTNFTAGQFLTINGFTFRNFLEFNNFVQLELDVDGDVAAEANGGFLVIVQPTITLAASPSTYNQGEESSAAPTITVSDEVSIGTPRIRAVDDIRIRIPAGLNMEFNTNISPGLVLSPGGSGAVGAVNYPDVKTMRIDVTIDFSFAKTLTITGAQFQNFGAASGPLGLDLDIAGVGTIVHSSSQTLQIGGAPSISSSFQSFTFADLNTAPTSNASAFTITDATGVPMIGSAQDIRIIIPASHPMTWDTTITSVSSNNLKVPGTVGNVSYPTNKICLLLVSSGFTSGESVMIGGLRFANFTGTGADRLELEVDGDGAVEDEDAFDKAVGRPNISSTANMTYNQNEEPTGANTIRVTDDGSNARIRADDTNGNIRIRIPAGLNLEWDTTVTTIVPVMGGGGSGNVAGGVAYSLDRKTAIFDVTADFTTNRFVDLPGLRFFNFGAASGPSSLELIVNGGTFVSVCRSDDKTIRVGGTPSIASTAQSFTFADLNTAPTSVASPITITDASGVPMIGPANGIRIIIPGLHPMTWDTTVTSVTSNNVKVPGTVGNVSYPTNKICLLAVSSLFTSGESVQISNLRFANFSGTGSDQLELEVDGDGAIEATDGVNKSVGRPNISSTANMTYNQGEEETPVSTIRVTDDGSNARIRADDTNGDIRIRIPAGLNLEWDTTVTSIVPVMGGGTTGTVAGGVAYSLDRKTATFNVTVDFTPGRFVDLPGLRFFNFGAASGPLSLELIVNGATFISVCRSDDKTIQVGGRATISSSANQNFLVGDAAINISPITVTDAAGVPMISTTNHIRLVIPAGLNMAWDSTVNTISSDNPKVSTSVPLANYISAKIVRLTVNNPFTSGESVTVSGLRFTNFAAAGTGSLEVEVDGDPATEDTDDKTIVIGGPTISSAAQQNFTKNDPSRLISQITIAESAGGAGIKAAREIRVKIPSALNLSWDTTDTGANLGGTAFTNGRVSATVSYEGLKTLLLQVSSDFLPGEVLTISGLSFVNPGNSSGPSRLELEIDADSDADALDAQTITIGSPTISSNLSQSFNVADPITPNSPIVVTEDPTNTRITVAGDIRIRIPAGLAMTWDTLDTVATLNMGPGSGTVSGVSFAEGDKVLIVLVTAPFSVGQTLTISNLGFTNFTAESSAAPLELIVNSTDMTVCNVDDKTKQIGGQASLVSASQSFALNDPSTLATSIQIQDAPGSPKINTTDNIEISIPAGLNMVWNNTIGTVGIAMSGAGNGNVSTSVTYSPDAKTVFLTVTQNFDASKIVTISNLQFRNFNATGSGQLSLECDADGTPEATDTGTKGIGAPTILSAGSQVFSVGPGPTGASNILITDDATFPRIRTATGLSVRIPASLNMIWNTSIGTAGITMGGLGNGNVSTGVTYSLDNKTAIFTVSQDFAASKNVTISGLAFQNFTAPSTPDFLQLDVSAAGTTTDLDAQSKAIQGSATLASATQSFTTNDPPTLSTSFTITDAGGVATITTGNDIRIKIPAGLNMVWNTSITAVTSDNADVDTTVSYTDAEKTVVLNVINNNFSPGESVTIGGLGFRTFGASSGGQLTLEIDGDPTAEATDTGTRNIGTPTLLSTGPQVFQLGPGPTSAVAFTVTDDANRPRIRLDNATGDIRIKIPAGLDMVWTNTTSATINMGGVGAGAVSTTVSYDVTFKTLILNVTADFAAGKSVTVSGLSFQNFNSPSLPAALELEVNNAGTNVGVDGVTKAIQGVPTLASAAQAFSKGDLATNAANLTITDAGGVAMINTTNEIRVKIPAGLNMTWDTTVTSVGTDNAKVSVTPLPYEDSNKTLVLNVTGNFGPAESVTISNLRFNNFNAAGSGQLTLELDGDPTAEATGTGLKSIGAPTISSGANQTFNVGDADTAIATITVTEDAVTPRLRFDNTTGDIRIRIPTGFNMAWDTTITSITPIVGPGAGTVSGTVSYAGDSVLIVNVLTDFSAGQTLQISGLEFTGFGSTSPADRLELEVNNAATVCNEDLFTKTIGGLPTISSASNQAFTVGDPATGMAVLTLTDASGVATFRATREIRVRIPAAFPMEWNTPVVTAVVTPGAGAGTASNTVSFLDVRTLQINITADFDPGQTLTVSGLSFRNFAVPGGSGARLELDVDLDASFEAQDDKTLAVGVPILSSASSQIFVVNDPTTAASAMTVTDGAVARITAANNLRIRIPASLNMTWDTDDTDATIGGSAFSKANTTVSYENSGKTLVVDILSDLGALETLVIGGLSFENFSLASTPANLELVVNGAGGTVADLDDKTKAVRGLPTIVSGANQAFTVGDPTTGASPITVTDAGGVAVITAGNDIRIRIPVGFGMIWNTALTTPTFGGATGKVNPLVTYPDNRTLLIDVTANFSPGEVLTISALGFRDFLTASPAAALGMDLDNDGGAEATDTSTIAIGAPTLSSAANQIFGVSDPATAASTITITDDPVTPRIRSGTDIRIKIPAGVNMDWVTGITGPALGGSAFTNNRVAAAVSYTGTDILVVNVISDFLPGEVLTIGGLQFTGFALPVGTDRLRLETNNLGTDAAQDARTVRVGTRPMIQSATTGDFNGNGSIDRIVVVFSEDVDGASAGVTNALGFTLDGYTLAFGLETSPGTVTYFIVETGVPDTGARPNLSYDPVTGALGDVDDGGLEPNAYGPTQVTDGAPPRIVGFAFFDDDGNGRLDRLVYTFSENMDETQEDLSDWKVLDADGVTDLLVGLTDGALVMTGNSLVVTLADTTGTIGLPRFLYVEDGAGGSLRDLNGLLLPSATNNAKPVANAGFDRTLIPTIVTLDGTASTDVDLQPLTYSWIQTGGPPVTLANNTSANPSFSAFASATYVFELTVSDRLDTATDSVSITILNVPPTPSAGVDQTVTAPAVVTLDASASFDTNGDAITFSWAQVGGASTLVLANDNTSAPTFPTAGFNEVFVLRVTVSDGVNTKTDDVTVRVNAPLNGVPTADPGAGYVGVVATAMLLDGSRSSDPDGDLLTYAWSPAVLLSSPTSPTPSFTPNAAGTYVFTLVVTDDDGVASAPVTTRVLVLPTASSNRPPTPIVTVSPASVVTVGTTVTLDGSASVDPDKQTVRFAWTEVTGPVIQFPNPSAAAPVFTPVVPGTYLFQLIVGDTQLESAPLLVPVHVLPAPGSAPSALVSVDLIDDPEGDNRVTTANLPITLDGATSTGAGLTFAWYQNSGPAVPLSGATTNTMDFNPTVAGVYGFTLVVRDADGLFDTETISLVVDSAGNTSPTADAGPDQAVSAGATVSLNGGASADPGADADGVTGFGSGLLAYWSQRSGPPVALSDPAAASPSFRPLVAGTYVFELVVSDGDASSLADTVSVTVTGSVSSGGGGGGGSGGGCGLTGFEPLLLLLVLRRRRYMGCDAAR